MGSLRIAIIIPAYNEGGTIGGVVRTVRKYGDVFVVDDASVDNTADQAVINQAVLFSNKINKGYEGAIERGIFEVSNLGYDYVITFDADGQHTGSDLEKIIEKIHEGYELVVGKRQYFPRLSERVFSKLSNFFFSLKDPLTGLKAYDINLYRERGVFDRYRSIGTELAIYAVRKNKNWIEVPISINDRVDSSRIGSGLLIDIRIFKSMLIVLYKSCFSEF